MKEEKKPSTRFLEYEERRLSTKDDIRSLLNIRAGGDKCTKER